MGSNNNNTCGTSDTLDLVGKAVLSSISYKHYPVDELKDLLTRIDDIIIDESKIIECEIHLKASGKDNFLFFLSNIIYNLKVKDELVLKPDTLKWLGSVWKNFIKRNITYLEYLPEYDKYYKKISPYYPGFSNIVSPIQNAHFVKQEFIEKAGPDYLELGRLEQFYRTSADILNTMRPTYFFLLDYYYEMRLATGKDLPEGVKHERSGLGKFGTNKHTFEDISILTCQSLGVIEASYLILKKKKSQKQLINIDGKQKFLSINEVYNIYFNKFKHMKNELFKLK